MILKQNDRYYFVAKPSGMVVIPARPGREGQKPQAPMPVLREWLEAKVGTKVWVVHRIDRETSGIVVFARTEKSHREASQFFEHRKAKKEYLFIAEGNPDRPIYRVKSPVGGQESLTQIEVIARDEAQGIFYGKALPQTGRRHQIRIHLQELGFPILGDVKYGSKLAPLAEVIGPESIALHAHFVAFPTKEEVRFSAPASWREISPLFKIS